MITNKLNLPQIFVDVLTPKEEKAKDFYRISVTELLLPTRMILLNKLYDIDDDVSDLIPALIGTAVHEYLEKNINDENAETEIKIEYKYNDNFSIVGKLDYLNIKESLIRDYKVTTVAKFMKKEFDDYYKQGLLYTLLVYLTRHIIIRNVEFDLLLKDFSKIKSINSVDYPKAPIEKLLFKINDSDIDSIISWVNNKLNDIELNMIHHKLPPCSDTDKWFTGNKYAVFKNVSDKRAAIVCDSEEEAHEYITNKCSGSGEIQIRKGENIRCKYYCKFKEICNQKGEEKNVI